MIRTKRRFAGSLLLPLALGLAGCNKSAPPGAVQQNSQDQQPAGTSDTHSGHDHDHADHKLGDQAQGGADNAAIAEALAELSPQDRSLAERQRICPVTEELLGSMGTPMKVEVSGQQVFLCCEGCKEELLEKPQEHLAKLKK